ncbi:CNNM domain-containing protein [Candidatus Coxiella mudrowiae]|uniref:CNNM domain-containing protein n=1 Tax=Candidatus Coxiella mudrowiae TaxID=2054173 RepID=UPI001FD3E9FD|nr:CNNM domain-containing protein [Candidatus Coxiella mudrowiae]
MTRKANVKAQRVIQLLQRPDRLIGVILIGNTFANILDLVIAIVIAVHFLGNLGVIVATVILTLLILIFAETTPKTLAVLIAKGSCTFTRAFNRAFKPEELRSIVREVTGKNLSGYQQMLLRILDLEEMTIEDVMIPRNQIYGIDVTDEWDKIIADLLGSKYDSFPLFLESIDDDVIGILNVHRVIRLLFQNQLTQDKLVNEAEEVYFISDVTLLNHQLVNFRQKIKQWGWW